MMFFLLLWGRPLTENLVQDIEKASEVTSNTRESLKKIAEKLQTYESDLKGSKQSREDLWTGVNEALSKISSNNQGMASYMTTVANAEVVQMTKIKAKYKDLIEKIIFEENWIKENFGSGNITSSVTSNGRLDNAVAEKEKVLEKALKEKKGYEIAQATAQEESYKLENEIKTLENEIVNLRTMSLLDGSNAANEISRKEKRIDAAMVEKRQSDKALNSAKQNLKTAEETIEELMNQKDKFTTDKTTLAEEKEKRVAVIKELKDQKDKLEENVFNLSEFVDRTEIDKALEDAKVLFKMQDKEKPLKDLLGLEFKSQLCKFAIDKFTNQMNGLPIAKEINDLKLTIESDKNVLIADAPKTTQSTGSVKTEGIKKRIDMQPINIIKIVLENGFPGRAQDMLKQSVDRDAIVALNDKLSKGTFDPETNTIKTDKTEEKLTLDTDLLKIYICRAIVKGFIDGIPKRADTGSKLSELIGQVKNNNAFVKKIKGMETYIDDLKNKCDEEIKRQIAYDSSESMGGNESWNDTVIAPILMGLKDLFPNAFLVSNIESSFEVWTSDYNNTSSSSSGSVIRESEISQVAKDSKSEENKTGLGGTEQALKGIIGAGPKTGDNPLFDALKGLAGG